MTPPKRTDRETLDLLQIQDDHLQVLLSIIEDGVRLCRTHLDQTRSEIRELQERVPKQGVICKCPKTGRKSK